MAHTREVVVVWCCLQLDDRRWKQCRNQNRLALLLCLRTLLGTGTVRASGCSVYLTSLTTKITVTLFTIISTYSPWRLKNQEARSTALQPIRLITRRVVLGRDCIWHIYCMHGRSTRNPLYIQYTLGQDYKRFSSMSRCSTHNLCSEMT